MTALAVVVARSRAENLARARAVSARARRVRDGRRRADRLEDLEHLAAQRTPREEAARRTGFPSVEAMERWCRRAGRHDLIQSLPAERSTP